MVKPHSMPNMMCKCGKSAKYNEKTARWECECGECLVCGYIEEDD